VNVALKRDLFRTDRRPSTVAYDPVRAVAPETPPAPKPTLSLVGLIGGQDGSAVVEGLPGVDGWRVVRKGDAVAGLRVRTISGDSVVITGMDTLWVLKVREPWQ
jgi:hypothetical protein